MKLDIYGKVDGKKAVVNTYEADTYDLMFGTCEDVANVVDLDQLKTGSDTEIIRMVGGAVIKSFDTVKGLLKDIFPGLTDEDLKNVKVKDIAGVLVDVVKYTITTLTSNSKN